MTFVQDSFLGLRFFPSCLGKAQFYICFPPLSNWGKSSDEKDQFAESATQ